MYDNNYYLMGYSQGGWATLAALSEIEHNDSLDFTIKAASCGAGAYNPMDAASYMLSVETYPGPLYLPYYLYSYQQYGTITNQLTLFFREPYASLIPGLFDGSYSNTQVNDQLTDTISNLLTADFLNTFTTSDTYAQLRTDLSDNSVSAWNVDAFIRFYHGTADEDVPISESENIFNAFVALVSQEKVQFTTLNSLDHTGGILPWGLNTILWFNQFK
jgi:hypothetical protein